MYTGRQSRTSITPEWAEKAMEFVELAFRRVPPDGCVWCPCACCGNRRKQSKYDMQIHLGKNGFQPDYTVWVYHGESRSSRTAKPSPGDNGNLHGKKDVEVAAAGGEEVSKPQVLLSIFTSFRSSGSTAEARQVSCIFRSLTLEIS
jgi:hypothetical protein